MKKIIMILGAVIALAGIYFGMQQYRNNGNDNVQIQATGKGQGQSCQQGSDCLSGICENNVCKPGLKAGEWCTNRQNCLSGSCTNNACDKKK